MRNRNFKQRTVVQLSWAIMLLFNLNLANATITYNYTSSAIAIGDFNNVQQFTDFRHTQEIPNGNTVTASITLESPLPADTTTDILASTRPSDPNTGNLVLSGNLTGFFTNPLFLSSAILNNPVTSETSILTSGWSEVVGQLTTDADGNIEDWNLVFMLRNLVTNLKMDSLNINSGPSEKTFFPLTLNGEPFNAADDLFNHTQNRKPYRFQMYDEMNDGREDAPNYTTQSYYTSEKGQWTRTDTAQAEPQLVYIPLDTTCRVVDTRGFASPFQANRLTQSFLAFGNQTELDAQRDDDHSKNLPACEPVSGLTPAAMAANITAVAKPYQSNGNIVARPSGLATLDSSLINFQSNNIANASIITLNTDNDAHFNVSAQLFVHQADIDNQNKVDVIVDISGYFYNRAELDPSTAALALTYVPLATPCRIVDTRASRSPLTQTNPVRSFLAWGNKTDLDAQRDQANNSRLPACLPVSGLQPSAMVSNITAVAKAHLSKGNIATYASDAATPESSLVNFQGNTIANASIVSLSGDNDQHFKIQANLLGDEAANQHQVDVVVDVMGYFYPQTAFDGQTDRPDLVYRPLASPCRIVDTRGFDSTFAADTLSTQSFRAWGNQTELDLQRDSDHSKQLPDCLPSAAANPSALVANVTAAARVYRAEGNIVAYAQGTTAPTSSLINFQSNNIANASILSINPDNDLHFTVQARLFGQQADNQRKVDVIIDVTGYFYPLASNPGSDPSTPTTVPSNPGSTTRISVTSDGQEAHFPFSNGNNNTAIITRVLSSISADGRWVAFQSRADNFVNEDTNIKQDIFVRDRLNGEITRISVASDGTQATDRSMDPSISADGRFVAFMSQANNLSEQDTNRLPDIYVHDRQTGETKLVSIASDGTQSNSDSYTPVISANGRFVAFVSWATNLADGDDNGSTDIYVHDRQTGTTERVSFFTDGTQFPNGASEPSISADGRFISFQAIFFFGTSVYVHDRQTGISEQVSAGGTHPGISANGRFVTYTSNTTTRIPGEARRFNHEGGIWVYDRQTAVTEQIFASNGNELPESQSESWPWPPVISTDGRYIASYSSHSNLVANDNNNALDVFVYDRQSQQTRRVSVSSEGAESHDDPSSDTIFPNPSRSSPIPAISANGQFVVFHSKANDLVIGDTNNARDVFVHELVAW